MPSIIRMPAVAAGATEVVLSDWSIEEAGTLEAAEPYATIETDKATVDLEADADGILLRQLVPAGASVEIGAAIALVAGPGEQVDDVEAALTDLGITLDATEPTFPERREVPVQPSSSEQPPSEKGRAAQGASAGQDRSAEQSSPGQAGARRFASPLARRLARQAGLEVGALQGTGPGGRIVRRDVERAAAQQPPVATARPAARPTAPADADSESGVRRVPHSRMRSTIARRLTQSTQEVPHFYLRGSARVDRLLVLREEIRADDLPVSVNDLVVRAVAQAHLLVPRMNVTWSEDAVLEHETVDVGVAVATDGGLLTPVVRDAAGRPLRDVVGSTRELFARAKEGRLAQHELEGGTIAVSNLGMFGVEDFTAIINPPQSSILAVGGVREEAVVEGGSPLVANVLRFTLSIDHRPLDGVVAAQWMRAFVDLLESPIRILT